MDCQLEHVPTYVTTCLILHNSTIMHNDTFHVSWVEDGQAQLQKNLVMPSDVATTSNILLEAQNVKISPIELHNRASHDVQMFGFNLSSSSTTKQMSMCRDAIAKSLFSRKLQRDLVGDLDDIHVGLSSEAE